MPRSFEEHGVRQVHSPRIDTQQPRRSSRGQVLPQGWLGGLHARWPRIAASVEGPEPRAVNANPPDAAKKTPNASSGTEATDRHLVFACVDLVIAPRNGLANRLRALASTHYLASILGAEARLAWLPCPAVDDDLEHLFKEGIPWTGFGLASTEERSAARQLIDRPPPEGRRDTYHAENQEVWIVGNRWGEQWAVQRLLEDLRRGMRPKRVLVVSGGNFHPKGERVEWLARKRHLYRSANWTDLIRQSVRPATESRTALHLRFGDLAHKAPSPRRVAMAYCSNVPPLSPSVTVFTDDFTKASPYMAELTTAGLHVDASVTAPEQRSRLRPVEGAAIDWLSLASSPAVAYFAHSSFGAEAALASGVGVPIYSGRMRGLAARSYGFVTSSSA